MPWPNRYKANSWSLTRRRIPSQLHADTERELRAEIDSLGNMFGIPRSLTLSRPRFDARDPTGAAAIAEVSAHDMELDAKRSKPVDIRKDSGKRLQARDTWSPSWASKQEYHHLYASLALAESVEPLRQTAPLVITKPVVPQSRWPRRTEGPCKLDSANRTAGIAANNPTIQVGKGAGTKADSFAVKKITNIQYAEPLESSKTEPASPVEPETESRTAADRDTDMDTEVASDHAAETSQVTKPSKSPARDQPQLWKQKEYATKKVAELQDSVRVDTEQLSELKSRIAELNDQLRRTSSTGSGPYDDTASSYTYATSSVSKTATLASSLPGTRGPVGSIASPRGGKGHSTDVLKRQMEELTAKIQEEQKGRYALQKRCGYLEEKISRMELQRHALRRTAYDKDEAVDRLKNAVQAAHHEVERLQRIVCKSIQERDAAREEVKQHKAEIMRLETSYSVLVTSTKHYQVGCREQLAQIREKVRELSVTRSANHGHAQELQEIQQRLKEQEYAKRELLRLHAATQEMQAKHIGKVESVVTSMKRYIRDSDMQLDERVAEIDKIVKTFQAECPGVSELGG